MVGMALAGMAQRPSQEVRYHIQATLNANTKSIDGQWEAVYVNHADSALHSIWIMLYPNAFASDRTNYSEELLRWGNTKYYFGKEEERGWIDSLNFTVDGANIVLEKSQGKIEAIQLKLEKPLQSGDSVHIATTFFTQIPYNFENNGYKENDFVLDVWCPLIAELGNSGWYLKPYSLFQYNKTENATFSVKLNTPNGFHIGTNGSQTNTNEFQYSGSDGLKWTASRNKNFAKNYSLEKSNVDSIRVIVAKKLFPDVFHSGKHPQNPSQWLGQVYQRFQRPVPFLADSLYWKRDSSLNKNRKLKLGLLYDYRHTDQYKYLFLSPAVGFNNYDKFMVGAFIHNYQLPQEPFSFALAPMYATGSKKFAGWGQMAYNIWQTNMHWQIGFAGNSYSISDFDIPNYPKFYQRMWRVVPSVNVTILDKEAASTRKLDLGLRSFILSQQRYQQYSTLTDTGYNNLTMRSTLFQLSAQLQDTRKLYPYSVSAVADAGKEFLRLGLTGKYFLNYDASTQGVSARIFAGKFFYLKNQTNLILSNNRAYNFTLNGPSGADDYSYSGYYVGRSETSGWMSQQIMERDGFFKVPMTVFRSMNFGTSDNWLAALNLAADIPDDYNFLKKADGTIKLFFDLGTYADLWSDVPPAGRFLYDVGFQISLCKSLVNIYVPVLYSKVFRDRFKNLSSGQGYFWKTVSFNINLSALQSRNRNSLWPQ